MSKLTIGDLIRDNFEREGIVLGRARAPDAKWLAIQEDSRLRNAAGPWWDVALLDGGGVLVPEGLAFVLRRATVDDVVNVMEHDVTDDGRATLLSLFSSLRTKKRERRDAKEKNETLQ